MGEKIRLLLVVDHDFLRQGMRQSLEEQADVEIVGEAQDEEDAVRRALRDRPDILLLDTARSRLDCGETTHRVKSMLPSVAILVLTAYDHEEPVWAILDAGPGGCVLRDLKQQEMIESLRAFRHGDRFGPPDVARKGLRSFRKEYSPPLTQSRMFLSSREMEIVHRAAEGLTNKEIARRLGLGDRTVQTHWRNIFNKLGVGSRLEVILYSLRKGWIELAAEEEGERSHA